MIRMIIVLYKHLSPPPVNQLQCCGYHHRRVDPFRTFPMCFPTIFQFFYFHSVFLGDHLFFAVLLDLIAILQCFLKTILLTGCGFQFPVFFFFFFVTWLQSLSFHKLVYYEATVSYSSPFFFSKNPILSKQFLFLQISSCLHS